MWLVGRWPASRFVTGAVDRVLRVFDWKTKESARLSPFPGTMSEDIFDIFCFFVLICGQTEAFCECRLRPNPQLGSQPQTGVGCLFFFLHPRLQGFYPFLLIVVMLLCPFPEDTLWWDA